MSYGEGAPAEIAELMLLRFLRFAAPGMMPWSLSWDAIFLPMVELT